jgi:hypothetical protein
MAKQKKVTKKVREAAAKLLKLFGDKGTHWIAGTEYDESGNYCLIGGLEQQGYSQELFDNFMPIQTDPEYIGDEEDIEVFESTPEFNDRDGWAPVRTYLKLLSKGVDPSNIYIGEDGKASVVEFQPATVNLKPVKV